MKVRELTGEKKKKQSKGTMKDGKKNWTEKEIYIIFDLTNSVITKFLFSKKQWCDPGISLWYLQLQ